MHIRRFVVAIILIVTGACAGLRSTAVSPELSVEASGDTAALGWMDGYWLSDGYGYALELRGDFLRFFHITSTTCVEADVSGESLDDVFGTRRVEISDRDVVYLASYTEPLEYRFNRVRHLPESCVSPESPTQAATMKTLIAYLNAHYGFFLERGVNASILTKNLVALAALDLSSSELFDRVSDELAPLSDTHVELSATIEGTPRRFDADKGVVRSVIEERARQNDRSVGEERQKFLNDFWIKGVGHDLLGGNGRSAGNDRIQYGLLNSNIGYIGIRSMGGFMDVRESQSESEVLEVALQDAIAWFIQEEVKSVVLDLSINSGGYEYLGRQIAGRFTVKILPAYSIYAIDEIDKTPWQQYIVPAKGATFLGPVYVLTSRETVSAAEALVLAMRARMGSVQVGEPTRGAISGKLAKLLPNQWSVTLANEIVQDHNGVNWEARGIPPDLALPVFPDGRLELNHKGALAELVLLIGT